MLKIPGATGRNPLVYGKFIGKRSTGDKHVPTVLIYGHYDVIAAENEKNLWKSDPFNLTGKNGYLYGRGTSDNKVGLRKDIPLIHNSQRLGIGTYSCIYLCCERIVKGRIVGCQCHLFN